MQSTNAEPRLGVKERTVPASVGATKPAPTGQVNIRWQTTTNCRDPVCNRAGHTRHCEVSRECSLHPKYPLRGALAGVRGGFAHLLHAFSICTWGDSSLRRPLGPDKGDPYHSHVSQKGGILIKNSERHTSRRAWRVARGVDDGGQPRLIHAGTRQGGSLSFLRGQSGEALSKIPKDA